MSLILCESKTPSAIVFHFCWSTLLTHFNNNFREKQTRKRNQKRKSERIAGFLAVNSLTSWNPLSPAQKITPLCNRRLLNLSYKHLSPRLEPTKAQISLPHPLERGQAYKLNSQRFSERINMAALQERKLQEGLRLLKEAEKLWVIPFLLKGYDKQGESVISVILAFTFFSLP